MPDVLYPLPYPSGEGEFSLVDHEGRTCVLLCYWEALAANAIAIIFKSLQAYRCTYDEACSLDQFRTGTDQLIDMGVTSWLKEIRESVADGEALRHMMICLEDGPCYEFICTGFEIEEAPPED